MAQLHHVIGAILRDIAQGRVSADLYSREISRYYEQDSLLKLFPIPRTEIKEIQIDLKFAISDVDIDRDRGEGMDAKLSGLLETFSDTFTALIFTKLTAVSKATSSWLQQIRTLDTAEFRARLKAEFQAFFELNKKDLIEEKPAAESAEAADKPAGLTLRIDETTDLIKKILDKVVYPTIPVASIENGEELLTAAKSSISRELKLELTKLSGEIEYLEAAEYKVDVLVTTETLQDIPESSISSIRLVAATRNYVWSQTVDKDGNKIQRLLPE